MQPVREAKEQKYVKPTREGLYASQVKTLETFYRHGAITKLQYEESLRNLTRKMGM